MMTRTAQSLPSCLQVLGFTRAVLSVLVSIYLGIYATIHAQYIFRIIKMH